MDTPSCSNPNPQRINPYGDGLAHHHDEISYYVINPIIQEKIDDLSRVCHSQSVYFRRACEKGWDCHEKCQTLQLQCDEGNAAYRMLQTDYQNLQDQLYQTQNQHGKTQRELDSATQSIRAQQQTILELKENYAASRWQPNKGRVRVPSTVEVPGIVETSDRDDGTGTIVIKAKRPAKRRYKS